MIGKMAIDIEFDYLASHRLFDSELLNLESLYSKFENNCDIQSYHGTKDNLISNFEKREFCMGISKCTYNEISDKKVDNKIFKSTTHGLNADFLNLFDHAMSKKEFEKDTCLNLENVFYQTKDGLYKIDYSSGLPQLYRAVTSRT